MRSWLAGVILAIGLALASPALAVSTWVVLTNENCTALGVASFNGGTYTAVNCCEGNKTGHCNRKLKIGDVTELLLYLVPAIPNSCTAAGVPFPCCTGVGAGATCGQYVSGIGGETLIATQLARVGLNGYIAGMCINANGLGVQLNRTSVALGMFRVKLYNAAANEVLTGTTLSSTLDHLDCRIFGY